MNESLPLCAVPGLMNDARVWQNQVDHLASQRIVRVADASGHDTIGAIATAALAEAPGPRFALAGFSLGGYVALEMIRQAPERIAALALIDTGPRDDTAEATENRRRMIAAIDGGVDFDRVTAAFLPRVVHPSRVDDASLTELLSSMARSVGVDGFLRQQQAAIARPDSRPMLASIRCPTVVVCGRDDGITPLALSEEMAAAIPGARLVVVDDCGHMAPLERPAAVTEAMVAWLAEADRIERSATSAIGRS